MERRDRCPQAFGATSLDRQAADLQSSGSIVHLIRPSAAATRALGPGISVMDPGRRSLAARAGFTDGRAAAEAEMGDPRAGPDPG
jgi:hypothetical protein